MNEKYAALFASESRDHLTAMEHALLALEREPDSRPHVDALFRAVHSLKGMSGVMGYDVVSGLAHAMESVLDAVRGGARAPAPDILNTLFEASDTLAKAVDAATSGGNSALDISDLVARLGASARPERTEGETNAPVRLPGVPVQVQLEPDTPLPAARAHIIVERLRTIGTVHGTTPALDTLGSAFNGSFTVFVETGEEPGTLMDVARSSGWVRDVQVRMSAAQTPASLAGTADEAWSTGDLKAPLQKYVRIELRRLDGLMNLVGELVTVRGRLQQLAAESGDALLDDTVSRAARLIGELQDGVLGSRMVPVWQVFDRFPRVVRDAARLSGKDVALVLEGREIELDRALLEQVSDPLVHLLRNAVDHGIEAPAERDAAGKSRTGRLILSARRERRAVVIEVRDDGRGVDRAKVTRKARALGWVRDDTELPDDELLRTIARPGFSTAERVSEVSGRGVGIDAVLAKVRALGGSVGFTTVQGAGTSFEIRLPISLAIIPAIIARVGDEAYALPLTHVTETLQPSTGAVRRIRGRPVFARRGEILPLISLRERTGLSPRDTGGQQIVILEVTDRRAALAVDRLEGQQDIVVKSFDSVRGAAAFFTGAATLADGTTALILDVGGLLEEH